MERRQAPGRRRPSRGADFELASRRLLESHGLTIVASNYRCRSGEIDIVAREGQTLVFVEVRARSNARYASAAASVDARKQQRLERAALHFLQRSPHRLPACRFDVIAWQRAGSGDEWQPQWIRQAFGSM